MNDMPLVTFNLPESCRSILFGSLSTGIDEENLSGKVKRDGMNPSLSCNIRLLLLLKND